MRISVTLAYPLVVGIEYLLVSQYVMNNGGPISALPFVMIGDITFVYIIIFLFTAYVLCGMAKIADKEADPQMPDAIKFFMKAKEKMLLIMIISTVCLAVLAVYHKLNDGTSMVMFVITEFIFSLILFGFLSIQGMSIIKKEVAKRVAAANDVKESQVENEEESQKETGTTSE